MIDISGFSDNDIGTELCIANMIEILKNSELFNLKSEEINYIKESLKNYMLKEAMLLNVKASNIDKFCKNSGFENLGYRLK